MTDNGFPCMVHELFNRDRGAVFKKALQQIIVLFTYRFDQFLTPFFDFIHHFCRDFGIIIPHSQFFIRLPGNSPAFNKVHKSYEIFFRTDGYLHRNGVRSKLFLDLVDDTEKIRSRAIHFVHKSDAGDIVFIGLPPYGFRLGFNASYGAKDGDDTVKNTQ